MPQHIETIIVGGGQAGLALSYYLTQRGREHIVLERAAQTAQTWRNERGDAFTVGSPQAAERLPGGVSHGP